jgi:hypothetical protein
VSRVAVRANDYRRHPAHDLLDRIRNQRRPIATATPTSALSDNDGCQIPHGAPHNARGLALVAAAAAIALCRRHR